jgi:hypothetical protein
MFWLECGRGLVQHISSADVVLYSTYVVGQVAVLWHQIALVFMSCCRLHANNAEISVSRAFAHTCLFQLRALFKDAVSC